MTQFNSSLQMLVNLWCDLRHVATGSTSPFVPSHSLALTYSDTRPLTLPQSFNYRTNKHRNTKYTKWWATQGILGEKSHNISINRNDYNNIQRTKRALFSLLPEETDTTGCPTIFTFVNTTKKLFFFFSKNSI